MRKQRRKNGELARDAYQFIAAFKAKHRYAPSYEEIAEGIGAASKNTVYHVMRQLIALGLVEQDSQSRSIQLVGEQYVPPAEPAIFSVTLRRGERLALAYLCSWLEEHGTDGMPLPPSATMTRDMCDLQAYGLVARGVTGDWQLTPRGTAFISIFPDTGV